MKKLIIAFAALALLSGSAIAGQVTTTSATIKSGTEHTDRVKLCTPMTGNWVNAATTHCMLVGSGAPTSVKTYTRTTEEPCEPKGKRS